jgi:hypothetical protein
VPGQRRPEREYYRSSCDDVFVALTRCIIMRNENIMILEAIRLPGNVLCQFLQNHVTCSTFSRCTTITLTWRGVMSPLMFTACHSVRRLTVNVAGINPVRTAAGQRRDGADSAVCVLFINAAVTVSVRLSHRSCSDILTDLRVGSRVVVQYVQFSLPCARV